MEFGGRSDDARAAGVDGGGVVAARRSFRKSLHPYSAAHRPHASGPAPRHPEGAREAWDKAGVVFVETFVDAALDACSRKFISPLGLRRVGVAAKKDFEVIQWSPDDRRKDMRRQELDDALRRLNRALVVDLRLGRRAALRGLCPTLSVRKKKSGSGASGGHDRAGPSCSYTGRSRYCTVIEDVEGHRIGLRSRA